jgi:hypothetical protein
MAIFDFNKFDSMVHNKLVSILVPLLVDGQIDIYRNTLDPFSAVIDCMIRNTTPLQFKKQEEARASQKTLQNKIGYFHEDTILCFHGWSKPTLVDVVNINDKIIAEIKNKHNTTKGNHKKNIYDDLESKLNTNYNGFTAYYVEVLPKRNLKTYNKSFTPPDNITQSNRPQNSKIRVIDGASFYEVISGNPDFLEKLCREYLPNALEKSIKKINTTRSSKLGFPSGLKNDVVIKDFFYRAYK